MSQEFDPQRELKKAIQHAWDRIVLDTDKEPNLSLIAAYVDGRLTDAETRHLASHLVECPAAWEVMEQMLPEDMPFPTVSDEEESPKEREGPETLSLREHSQLKPTRGNSKPTWLLTMAAGWGAALLCGGLVWHMQGEATDLRQRLALADQTRVKVEQLEQQQRVRASQLARLELTDLAQQAAPYRSVFVIGDADLGMVRVAMRENRVRGPEQPSEVAEANIDKTLARLREALQDATPADLTSSERATRLAEVASLIIADELSQADAILTELEATPDTKPLDVRNARAVWRIAKAETLPPSEAEPLLITAESTLREIAAAGESNAWLNLALLFVDQGRAAEASLAASKYLGSNPAPAIAELVRQRFSVP